MELVPPIGIGVLVVFAGWGLMRLERRRFRKRMERLPEHYRPVTPSPTAVVLGVCGVLAAFPLGALFGDAGFYVAPCLVFAALMVVSRPFNRAHRARVRAVIADVQRRAPSMPRSELEQLVKNLEAVHGSRVQPLRKLLA